MARKKRKKRIGKRKRSRKIGSHRKMGRSRRRKRIGASRAMHHRWGKVHGHKRRVAKPRRRKRNRIGSAPATGGQFMGAHNRIVRGR